jgi:hypothetical protein
MKGRLAVAVASRAVLARGIAHVTTPTAIAARRQAAGRSWAVLALTSSDLNIKEGFGDL